MSKVFLNAIGLLLFLAVMIGTVYLVGGFIEDAAAVISTR